MNPLQKSVSLAAGLVLVAGAACSNNDKDGLRADTESIDSSQPADDDETSTGGETDTNESAGSSLGSATGKMPADPGDSTLVPLRIDVVALERDDDLVELRVRLTNEGEAGSPDFEPWSGFADSDSTAWDFSGAALVDGGAKKLYLPVLDSEGDCLCNTDMAEIAIPPGESVEISATYGGVPDDVDELDVRVPSFPSIEGVPVR
jgi:hypothetical protein